MKREKLAVAGVILIAALLRIYEVVRFPFEQDELYTIDEATHLFHTRLAPGIQARPVFFLIEHLFLKLVPTTAQWLRLLPLVFGIAGVWATWRLARDVIGPRGGLIALILAALVPWQLYVSGFARYYSLLYLLAALVYWLLPRAYDRDDSRSYLLALVPLLAGSWTHPSFVFPMIGVALALSVVGREGMISWKWPTSNAWRFLWGPFLVGSALIFLIIRVLHHDNSTANGGDRGLLATLRLVPAMVDWMTPVVAVAALAGALLMLRAQRAALRRFGIMTLLAVGVTLPALFGLSFVTGIYADYGIACLPLLLVCAAWVVPGEISGAISDPSPDGVRAASAARYRGSAVAAILIAGVAPSSISHLSDGTRFDYRPAFAQILRSSPQTEVLTWPIALQRAYAPTLHARELPVTASGLDSALTSARDIWVVTSVKRYGIVGDDTEEIARWLRSNCRQAGQSQRPRFDYRMYRVDLWRCISGSS